MIGKIHQLILIADLLKTTYFSGVKLSFRGDKISTSKSAYSLKVNQTRNMENEKATKHPLTMTNPL